MYLQHLLSDRVARDYQGGDGDAGIDGGAGGSGMIPADPTQGPGTSAWQQAQRMAAEINARQRRN